MNQHLVLQRKVQGRLRPDDLAMAEARLPVLEAGDVLVRNTWQSIDPSIRIRLASTTPRGYLPPFKLGEPLVGLALGTVVESKNDQFEPGDQVSHMFGFRDFAVVGAGGDSIGGYGSLTRIDTAGFPLQWYLGPLGSSGLTAYAGLIGVLDISAADTVWISAAAGAVGSVAAKLAKLRGCKVIGSAGSADKVTYLTQTLHLDAVFAYHAGNITELLAKAAPEGITAYFDSVGGDHLTAALDNRRNGGRDAVCGSLADYNTSEAAAGPANLFQLVSKQLRLQGFRAGSFNHLEGAMRNEIGGYLTDGRMVCEEMVFEGLDQAPTALAAMLGGQNTGKTLCRLADS
ncbi:MDR family NADP-dependent oxidoreductase [Arthrobacter bambusae]|uniref:MDR family NADP-dependent oxidoreductase n=1 Tax=Arthrobacter bambusae TaxID=1338426 RepID=UPI0027D8231E|nr:NADP-dependent oxidoreductase [Arthrobacter bambusae]